MNGFRTDDFQIDGLPVDLDRPVADDDTRQNDFHRILCAGQNCPSIFRAQLFKRLAATSGDCFKKGQVRVFNTWAARSEGIADGEGEEGGGQGLGDDVHEEFLFFGRCGP